jgi:hypothetical protein
MKTSKLSTKLKSGGIIISFIILSGVILFGFRLLEKRVRKAKVSETYTLDTINWAGNTIGFQPRLIEDRISQDKDEINRLIYDLNKVNDNGETDNDLKLIQQQIILLIHQYSDPKIVEEKVKNIDGINKFKLKESWFNELGYSLKSVKQLSGGAWRREFHPPSPDARGGPIEPALSGESHVLSTDQQKKLKQLQTKFDSQQKEIFHPNLKTNPFITDKGHHNRLMPNSINNHVVDENDWNKEINIDELQKMNEAKRDNMLKRILYTNYNEDLNGVIDYLFKRTDITSTEEGKRGGINEYIQNISTLFNRNIDELIEHFLVGEGQQIIINKKFEKVDPYYRILYPGWESSESSILNKIWPFYKVKKNNDEVEKDRDEISFQYDNNIFLKERPDESKFKSYNPDNQIYLNEQGKTFKNTEYGFLEDPITRKQPIWPLDIPVEPLHRSKRPILKENDGSFKQQTIDYKNFGKFIEAGILLKLLGKINNNKKIAVGITIVYITLSIYIFSYINKKTKRKKNEDIDDYRKRIKTTNKIKNFIVVFFPFTYYIVGLFSIVSYNRYKHGKDTDYDISSFTKLLESSKKNVNKYLFTSKHINILNDKISYFKNGNIQNLTATGYLSSGIMIFFLSLLLFFVVKLFKLFPSQSKIATLIITFFSIVGLSIYLIYKYRDILSLFIPGKTTIFGTTNYKDIVKILSILIGIGLILIFLLFGKSLNIHLSTNGKGLLTEETSLNNIQNIKGIQSKSNFCISSWFYFVGTQKTQSKNYNDYIPFFNFDWNPILLFNSSTGNLKILFEDDTGNQVDVYDSPITLQKWNNIVINFNGSTVDIFINSKLIATKTNIYIKNKKSTISFGSLHNLKKKICYMNTKCDKTRCFIDKEIKCDDKCKDNKTEDDCSSVIFNNALHGGMANIVYFDSILKLNEIQKNYDIFKKTLKNKVY